MSQKGKVVMNGLETRTYTILKDIFGEEKIVCQAKEIFGTPDFLIPSLKLVVLSDGGFWHDSRYGRSPMTEYGLRRLAEEDMVRGGFWLEKAAFNRAHDRNVSKTLRAQGYIVVRLKEAKIIGRNGGSYVSRAIAMALQAGVCLSSKPRPKRTLLA